MSWFVANKDLVAIAIATIAIVVSLITVVVSRRQQQMNAYLQLNNMLSTRELRDGRRLAYRLGEGLPMPDYDSDDMLRIDQSLAMLDQLGMFTRRSVIPRRWVLDYWHLQLRDLRTGYNTVVQMHGDNWFNGGTPYPDLGELINRAERYSCRLACCNAAKAMSGSAPARTAPVLPRRTRR
jgi:hypothetical protein